MKIHVLKLKLRKLHKYIGFAFSLFIVHLTITGILLTYPKTFKIEETLINNYYILKKYNMETFKDVFEFKNDKNDIILIKNNIYLNDKFIDKFKEDIFGVFFNNIENKLYVLSSKRLIIYLFAIIDEELEIEDILTLNNEKSLNKLGINIITNEIILKKDSMYYKLVDNSILKLIKTANVNDYNWSNMTKPNKDLANHYLTLHQGSGVSIIRILTELHNGKFFGSIFTLILFFSSLSLLFLTFSSFIFATNLFKNKKK